MVSPPRATPPAPDLSAERRHRSAGRAAVAGVDEAGRGCLAGPVVAAAVVLPPGTALPGLADSKKLSAEAREALVPRIRRAALAVGVGRCSPAEVDRLNVLWASLEAMRRAADALEIVPDVVLVDGDKEIPDAPWPQEAIVKGDARSLSIAAASVVAKVTRDQIMVSLDADFPAYGWARHKGYPTAAHYAALEAHGPSPHHRRSFRLTR
jgi:ribonuclease HII